MRAAKYCISIVGAVLCVGLLLKADAPQVPSGAWAGGPDFGVMPSQSASAVLQDGRIVVAGGIANGAAIATVAIYDPSNLGAMPGNVRLRSGEAGLPHASVVNVSQIRTIDRTRLVDRTGVLGAARMRDVLRGLALLFGTDEGADANT